MLLLRYYFQQNAALQRTTCLPINYTVSHKRHWCCTL